MRHHRSYPPLWRLTITILCIALNGVAQGFDNTHARFDGVVKTHVAGGMVDYKALKAKSTALDLYLKNLAAVPEKTFKTWTESERLAFLINLYNATTLRLILDHYPVKTIKDIKSFLKGPWDKPVVRLFDREITLNNLEHDIIRKEYNEPRIHMALVCAARGCPPLRSEAFTGKRLDKQLDSQCATYLKSPKGLVIDRAKKTAHLSAIFKWYGKDFSSVSAFVEKHSGESLAGLKIRYIHYDWSLNNKAP